MRTEWLLLALFVSVSAGARSDANEVAPESAPDSVNPSVVDYFARDTFRIESYVCPFKNDIDYEPGDIECGLLQVPENREKPDSRFIELHFVKLVSTWDDEEEDSEEDSEESTKPAPGKRDDPVIYLSGGPGAHATGYVKRFNEHKRCALMICFLLALSQR